MHNNETIGIYDYILENIHGIEYELRQSNGSSDVDKAKQQALNIIMDFNKEVTSEIDKLKQNQEWDTFTIAFYGETNAGKSTIIESLRIHFQEHTKLENQKKFQNILNEFETKKSNLNERLSVITEKIDKYEQQSIALIENFNSYQNEVKAKIFDLQTLHSNRLEKSFVYKFISKLGFSRILKNITELNEELSLRLTEHNKKLVSIEHDKEVDKQNFAMFEKQISELQNSSIELLNGLSDGNIIGDGRSDFTKQTTKYSFDYNEQRFAFLDVPGIEGDESAVIDEVALATKKAHAVFYVTNNSRPPQKGDENKKGTLEKIKEHLGLQTEVYSLFNKRINNPMQLEKHIIGDEEKASLKDLDDKMREVIGSNYMGCQCISAYVSFLAVAEFLIPSSETLKSRKKFLDKHSRGELLQKALFNDFSMFLTKDLVQNTQLKIKKSNFNKAYGLLSESILLLEKVSKEVFEPLRDELSKESIDASSNLDKVLGAAKLSFQGRLSEIMRNFETKTRSAIYEYVESDVSDSEFKDNLEFLIKNQCESINNKITYSMNEEVEYLQKAVDDVLKDFYRRVIAIKQRLQISNINIANSNFKINLNLDNGIDGFGILGGMAGAGGLAYAAFATSNAWNPVGWAMFAIGAITVIISLAKAVWKMFSSDYKQSEQKKAADENIKRIKRKIEGDIFGKIDSSFIDFKKITTGIKESFMFEIDRVSNTNEQIIGSKEKLIVLLEKIKSEGEK